jgi:hypothetical protein
MTLLMLMKVCLLIRVEKPFGFTPDLRYEKLGT